MKKQFTEEDILKKIKEIYISEKGKYLVMTETGYVQARRYLKDSAIKNHLLGKETIGVYSGQYLSKFICFDIDCNEESDKVTRELINCLIEDFNIPRKYIIVSLSGSKGYHVEIFVNGVIGIETFKKFYTAVLAKMNESPGRIEFRPTGGQGVKIPLGIHKRTKKRCWYVDNRSLVPIRTNKFILEIETIPVDEFRMLFEDSMDEVPFTLANKDGDVFENIFKITNLDFKSIKEVHNDIFKILQDNSLIYPNTRHHVTLMLSMFFYAQGWDIDDTRARIKQVLVNTWVNKRHLIHKETTEDFMLSEVDRLSEIVYVKGYEFRTGIPECKIYRNEIIAILNLKRFPLMQLMFSLLVLSKRFARQNGQFYMAYSTMTKMGSTSYRSTLIRHVNELESAGYIKVVERGMVDKGLCIELKKPMNKPNVYEVRIKADEAEPYIVIGEREQDLKNSIVELVPVEITKKMLSKNQFYKNGFAQLYKNKNIS